jgi:PAS domain S-box-containing protein
MGTSIRGYWLQLSLKPLAFAIVTGGCTALYMHSAWRALADGASCALLCVLLDMFFARRNAKRLHAAWLGILNDAESGTVLIEFPSTRFHASDEWNAMLGYTREQSPKTRDQFLSLIDPADRAAVEQSFEAHIHQRSESSVVSFRIRRGDGRWHWVRSRGKIIDWYRHGRPKRLIGITWDIDEASRAAEVKAEMAGFMKSTLSSIPSHIAVIDRDGKILLANDSWNRFPGRRGSLGERPAVGDNYLERLRDMAERGDATAREAHAMALSLFANEATEARLEYETGPDKRRSIFKLRMVRFDSTAGPRLTLVNTDITEARTVERSLRESEERWKFAIEGSGDAVWDWNVEQNTVHRSAQFYKMLGLATEAGFGQFDQMQDLAHPEDRALVKAKYAGLISGTQDLCAFEYRLKHNDGSWRWIMARCTVMRRDEARRALRILGVHTDITALKQAESQLRVKQAENRLLALVAEHTTNSVLITDATGHIEWVNRGFEVMTGYKLDEVRGSKPGAILQGPGSDQQAIELMHNRINAGAPLRTKILNYRKDKQPFWASIEIQPVRGGAGEIRHFVGVTDDVTERDKLEAERRLSQKLQSVGQLAAGIAHEINTPVQFVGDSITFLDEAWSDIEPLVRRGPPGADLAGGADTANRSLADEDVDFLLSNFPVAIARAKDGLQRVTGIVRAMKEFAHPDQGDFSRADVNRALQNATVVARNEYKYVGTVTTECGELPAVLCRVSSISQVLLNLIVNAAHALADQGRIPDDGIIALKTRLEGDFVVISVTDNGCGIPDEIRERIFDPFFTSKEVGRGTGQGLAIARAIVVEQHGGRIVVKSKVGEGSTFEVWLPKDGPKWASNATRAA